MQWCLTRQVSNIVRESSSSCVCLCVYVCVCVCVCVCVERGGGRLQAHMISVSLCVRAKNILSLSKATFSLSFSLPLSCIPYSFSLFPLLASLFYLYSFSPSPFFCLSLFPPFSIP